MYPSQDFLLAPIYEGNSCRCIGIFQQLQLLLRSDATLADVAQMIQCFQREFGDQEQLENVIQSLVGHFLAKQVVIRCKRCSNTEPAATHSGEPSGSEKRVGPD